MTTMKLSNIVHVAASKTKYLRTARTPTIYWLTRDNLVQAVTINDAPDEESCEYELIETIGKYEDYLQGFMSFTLIIGERGAEIQNIREVAR